ncbi:MAG: hypothetical protein ACTHJT_13315 [Cytophaga sp.]|uniref:hypothetical protein n=1 Tax=Cytophaga sp. TaxID=29535 RepID=UPI003F7E9E34
MKRKYFNSIGIVFLLELILVVFVSLYTSSREIFLLGFVGIFFTSALLAIINLLFFIQTKDKKINYVIPAVCSVLIFIAIWHKDADWLFFVPGALNCILCFRYYLADKQNV